jgi:hypothetical protein
MKSDIATWGPWYWGVSLCWIFALIMGPEVYALFTNPRNTLSDTIWTWLSVTTEQQNPWTAAHFLVFGGWLVLVTWLTFHFFFRRFT